MLFRSLLLLLLLVLGEVVAAGKVSIWGTPGLSTPELSKLVSADVGLEPGVAIPPVVPVFEAAGAAIAWL